MIDDGVDGWARVGTPGGRGFLPRTESGEGDGRAKSSNELEARVVSIPINITKSRRTHRRTINTPNPHRHTGSSEHAPGTLVAAQVPTPPTS